MSKPVRARIEFEFECKHCGCGKWLTDTEAQTKGFKFVCSVCDKATAITNITNFNLSYEKGYSKDVEEKVELNDLDINSLPESLEDEDIEDVYKADANFDVDDVPNAMSWSKVKQTAVDLIVAQGFNRTEAADLVRKALSNQFGYILNLRS